MIACRVKFEFKNRKKNSQKENHPDKTGENIIKFTVEVKTGFQALWNNENNIEVIDSKLTPIIKEASEITGEINGNINNKGR